LGLDSSLEDELFHEGKKNREKTMSWIKRVRKTRRKEPKHWTLKDTDDGIRRKN